MLKSMVLCVLCVGCGYHQELSGQESAGQKALSVGAGSDITVTKRTILLCGGGAGVAIASIVAMAAGYNGTLVTLAWDDTCGWVDIPDTALIENAGGGTIRIGSGGVNRVAVTYMWTGTRWIQVMNDV
jgi:hypothetical protein